jgi:hypothetical protein
MELAVGEIPTQPFDDSWLFMIEPESLRNKYMSAAIN